MLSFLPSHRSLKSSASPTSHPLPPATQPLFATTTSDIPTHPTAADAHQAAQTGSTTGPPAQPLLATTTSDSPTHPAADTHRATQTRSSTAPPTAASPSAQAHTSPTAQAGTATTQYSEPAASPRSPTRIRTPAVPQPRSPARTRSLSKAGTPPLGNSSAVGDACQKEASAEPAWDGGGAVGRPATAPVFGGATPVFGGAGVLGGAAGGEGASGSGMWVSGEGEVPGAGDSGSAQKIGTGVAAGSSDMWAGMGWAAATQAGGDGMGVGSTTRWSSSPNKARTGFTTFGAGAGGEERVSSPASLSAAHAFVGGGVEGQPGSPTSRSRSGSTTAADLYKSLKGSNRCVGVSIGCCALCIQAPINTWIVWNWACLYKMSLVLAHPGCTAAFSTQLVDVRVKIKSL